MAEDNILIKEVKISVVACVYNEEKNIEEFNQRMIRVLNKLNVPFEIIYVDDGSTDNSYKLLNKFTSERPEIKVIKFTRNFGQHVAATAGFDHARGKRILWIDTDLQEEPEDLLPLMKKIDEGYDIVFGIRNTHPDRPFKISPSRIFFKLLSFFLRVNIPQGLSTIRLMNRQVIDHLHKLPEHTRFITGLQFWHGFSYSTIEIKHNKRIAGKSSYTLRKLMRLANDALFSFTAFPLKIALYLSLFCVFLCIALIFYIAGKLLILGIKPTPFALTLCIVFFLSATQFLILGIIGEYIGKVYIETMRRPLYVIDKTINIA